MILASGLFRTHRMPWVYFLLLVNVVVDPRVEIINFVLFELFNSHHPSSVVVVVVDAEPSVYPQFVAFGEVVCHHRVLALKRFVAPLAFSL